MTFAKKIAICILTLKCLYHSVLFLDLEGGSQKGTLVVLVIVVVMRPDSVHSDFGALYIIYLLTYQFSKGPKIPKAFLIRSGVQRNFAYTFFSN